MALVVDLVVALVVALTMVVVPVERVLVLALVLVRLWGLAEPLLVFVLRRVFCFHCSFAQFSALGLYSHRMVCGGSPKNTHSIV